MLKERAGRNRTITLSENDKECYADKCMTMDSSVGASAMNNTLILGDFFDIQSKLPHSFIDLLIVDPPYNMNKVYGESKFKKMNEADYSAFTESWILKVKPLLKNTATLYVCCDWKSSLIIGSVLHNHFTVQNRITWQREKGRGATHNWKNSMEDIWFATVSPKEFTFNVSAVKMRRQVIAPYKVDGKPKDWIESECGNYRDTFPSNFWDDISVPYWSMPENTDHPAQKPEKLIAKLILASSNPGDMVFDPFFGSGTTAVVAKKLKRRYSGVENERDYCAVAQKRLEMADADSRIQGYADEVFWERNTGILQQKFGTPKQQSFQPSLFSAISE